MADRCYRYKGVLIPECWSRAIWGDNAPCTCPKRNPKDVIAKLEARVSRLEAEVGRLKKATKAEYAANQE